MASDNLITAGMTGLEEVAHDILSLRTLFVNVVFIGEPGSRNWVLVDTGMASFTDQILHVATERFSGPPSAIILTHGHFDHVGTVIELEQFWGVPVYAHPLELPYLTGVEDYPPADPTVGGGLMARLSFVYPNEAINLDDRIFSLPDDHSIPGVSGWEWLHTPGHTPGHVSLFRKEDRILIAGDAIVTVKQESLWSVLLQDKQLHGPPAYFTTDWQAAHRSVQHIRRLEPIVAVTGHGHSLTGEMLRDSLERLDLDFEESAIPDHGKYVD
ncbi:MULTISPECIES: MBL fold metallo-hydrolase [Paenibacillus]|uniref:Glyoxylase-like metal-dependent hydrolase (Beta-lactamase superfamily II) n=1 Tax=Paenibacillus pabuli TaxID=1472 RepID=A0A855XUZ9_9BACL|nr:MULTISPECIES: MBL fold metallo-hydrolase [Paenibacillus]PWW38760.1 glyoxylase-like metal-dependent hydrolase (beta-lactamase superfamily II) [Paenibacillus pabuli]PXW05945.1 glyoxylase-like metal-dependent hydrolase (beta-lactamase superfamily II) [Paenibacillus taichungensis]RAI83580.1 glyoxylase-like metal-dependent hydrolase (beta-lactamase superfamily II) [Paenibacillus pabuli]